MYVAIFFITLYLTQQNCECLYIQNRQYTELHILNFLESSVSLEKNSIFLVPWDLISKDILITRPQKSRSTQSELQNDTSAREILYMVEKQQ